MKLITFSYFLWKDVYCLLHFLPLVGYLTIFFLLISIHSVYNMMWAFCSLCTLQVTSLIPWLAFSLFIFLLMLSSLPSFFSFMVNAVYVMLKKYLLITRPWWFSSYAFFCFLPFMFWICYPFGIYFCVWFEVWGSRFVFLMDIQLTQYSLL